MKTPKEPVHNRNPSYFRKDHLIKTPERIENHETKNRAKKASRKIQIDNGGLGKGSLAVVSEWPS